MGNHQQSQSSNNDLKRLITVGRPDIKEEAGDVKEDYGYTTEGRHPSRLGHRRTNGILKEKHSITEVSSCATFSNELCQDGSSSESGFPGILIPVKENESRDAHDNENYFRRSPTE